MPTDYIEACTFNGNKMVINGEEFSCMIFPYSEYLPLNTLKAAARLRDNGVPVIFIDNFPKGASDAPDMDISDLDDFRDYMEDRYEDYDKFDADRISEAYAVKIKVKAEVDGDKDSTTMIDIVYRYKGSWYLLRGFSF